MTNKFVKKMTLCKVHSFLFVMAFGWIFEHKSAALLYSEHLDLHGLAVGEPTWGPRLCWYSQGAPWTVGPSGRWWALKVSSDWWLRMDYSWYLYLVYSSPYVKIDHIAAILFLMRINLDVFHDSLDSYKLHGKNISKSKNMSTEFLQHLVWSRKRIAGPGLGIRGIRQDDLDALLNFVGRWVPPEDGCTALLERWLVGSFFWVKPPPKPRVFWGQKGGTSREVGFF